MSDNILIPYGSYRSDRQGIRLAHYLVDAFAARGARPELIGAKGIGLPILDRITRSIPRGPRRPHWRS